MHDAPRIPRYAAKLLAPDEQVVFVTHPRAARLGLVLTLGSIFLVLAIFAAIVEPGMIGLGVLPGLPLLGAHVGHLVISPVIFVTDRRVVSAARGQKSLAVDLAVVKRVRLSQKTLERFFHYGDVDVLIRHPVDQREGTYIGYEMAMVADARGLAEAISAGAGPDAQSSGDAR